MRQIQFFYQIHGLESALMTKGPSHADYSVPADTILGQFSYFQSTQLFI